LGVQFFVCDIKVFHGAAHKISAVARWQQRVPGGPADAAAGRLFERRSGRELFSTRQ
jgi:hypothetical protein